MNKSVTRRQDLQDSQSTYSGLNKILKYELLKHYKYKQMNKHKPAIQLNRTSEKLSNINVVDGTFEFWQ